MTDPIATNAASSDTQRTRSYDPPSPCLYSATTTKTTAAATTKADSARMRCDATDALDISCPPGELGGTSRPLFVGSTAAGSAGSLAGSSPRYASALDH